MSMCAETTYHEGRMYEEHQKGIEKLRRLWWKIWRKVNQKSTSLEEGCLTEAGEIMWRTSDIESDCILGSEGPRIHVNFSLIL
jgi:hypothetical protein